jgi:hypothetical protein
MSMGEKSSKSIDSHPYPTLLATSWAGVGLRHPSLPGRGKPQQLRPIDFGNGRDRRLRCRVLIRLAFGRKTFESVCRPAAYKPSKLDQSESPMLGN